MNYPRKVEPSDWIGHSNCAHPTMNERVLIDRRDEIVILGEVEDAEANYSYDDYALIRLDGDYYLLNTSGCSCPDPNETWSIVHGPCSLDEIEKTLREPGAAYGVTARQFDEFLAMIATARNERGSICP